jgi:hypothetical protein
VWYVPIDIDKLRGKHKDMKRRREEAGQGGVLRVQENGEHRLYIAGPCREDEDLPYVEMGIHFGLGSDGKKKALCLNPKDNPIILDPRLQQYLPDGHGLSSATECPGCAENRARWNAFNKLPDKTSKEKKAKQDAKTAAEDIKFQRKLLWNAVALGYRKEAGEDWEEVEPNVQKRQILEAGPMLGEAMVGVFVREGDITDPEKANAIVASRSGDGFGTKYEASIDSDTVRKPIKLPQKLRKQLAEDLTEGGAGDLYAFTAKSYVPLEDFKKLVAGIDVEGSDEGVEADEDDAPPDCFGASYTNDNECKTCAWRGLCSKKLKKPLFKGHELKPGDHGYKAAASEDEEEEEAPAPKKAAPAKASKKAPEPEPEEEEQEEVAEGEEVEEAEEEEEEEAPAPPPKKAAKPAAAPSKPGKKAKEPEPEPEEEEEEVEEEPEAEEEEEEPPPPPKKGAAKPGKPAAKAAVDEDEDTSAFERELAARARGKK